MPLAAGKGASESLCVAACFSSACILPLIDISGDRLEQCLQAADACEVSDSSGHFLGVCCLCVHAFRWLRIFLPQSLCDPMFD